MKGGVIVQNVLMKRVLFGVEVVQRTEDEFIRLGDIEKAGNKWRVMNGLEPISANYLLGLKSTKEFTDELERRIDGPSVVVGARGRGNHTWIHPYMAVKLAMAFSPKFQVDVMAWMFDELVKYRCESGDNYKLLSGALDAHFKTRQQFVEYIKSVANRIRTACMVVEWNKATAGQLALRKDIHDLIIVLADVVPPDVAVDTAIKKATAKHKVTLSM